jgi:choline dehydrogenase-like flavoprotein
MAVLDYDMVIVGSGAAGGLLAERLSPLCRQGARIALLEAGPFYTRHHFNQREDEMSKLFWARGAFYARDGSLSVAMGRCVGGSTTVYTAVTFRTPRAVVEDWQRHHGVEDLDPADLDARFMRIERELEVGEMAEERVNENNRLFRAGCRALGWKCLPLRLAATLECNGCGFCNLGCWNGSKKSTLEVHIPRALGQGVELIPNCQVEQVSESGVCATVFTAPAGTAAGPTEPGLLEIRARLILLAAGALHSPAILLRSPLRKRSPALGRFVTLHPAVTLSGILPHEVLGFGGYPKTFYTEEFAASHHYLIETAFNFPGVTAKNLAGFGHQHKDWMKQYRRFMSVIVLKLDEPEERNRVSTSRRGTPVLYYRLSKRSVSGLVHSMRSVSKIFFAAGAETALIPASRTGAVRATACDADLEEQIHPRFFRRGLAPVASAHPQGGCRMGPSIESSVVDSYGRLHGAANIFVADASVFPTSVKVNPYLSVMVLADRTADYVRRNISQWM